jgi:ABC-type molybdate transport system ATPase subunit
MDQHFPGLLPVGPGPDVQVQIRCRDFNLLEKRPGQFLLRVQVPRPIRHIHATFGVSAIGKSSAAETAAKAITARI